MGKIKTFDDKKLPELIRLYKDGATISELKERYGTYGNPLVRRLKEAGAYKAGGAVKRAKKAAVKPKAAQKPRKAATQGPAPKKAATATTAPESTAPAAEPAIKPIDPLAAATVVDTNGAAVGRANAWSAEEEREISRLQETEGLSRKSAIQKMKRLEKRQGK